ncbi:MAG: hypothetical protein VB957_11820 [Pseudomonadales bacterium]|jgi:F0F1-type ATP synthase assembly protein I
MQFIAMILLAGLSIFIDWAAAYSSLLGSLVTVVPGFVCGQAVFGQRRFGQWKIVRSVFGRLVKPNENERFSKKVSQGEQGLSKVVRGLAAKFVLSIAMFIAIFVWVPQLNALFFFGSFVGMQLMYIIAPLVIVPILEDKAGMFFKGQESRVMKQDLNK